MESRLLVTKRMNDNLLKQDRIPEKKCTTREQYSRWEYLETSGTPDSSSGNNLDEIVLKIFNETGATVDSRDFEACHHLNQPAKPKKIIIKLSKRKDTIRVMNNKNKWKSIRSQNYGIPSSFKFYKNGILCIYYK